MRNHSPWPLDLGAFHTKRYGPEILSEQLAKAAREETRIEEGTGRHYRANLAVVEREEGGQRTIWGDIDTAPRSFAQKAFIQRREQMVGDAVQLTFDVMHWNSVNMHDEPIAMVMDFTDDVEERLMATELEPV